MSGGGPTELIRQNCPLASTSFDGLMSSADKALLDSIVAQFVPIPSQTGQAGKVLSTDGVNLEWVPQSGGSGTTSYESVADLRAATPPSNGTTVLLSGYYEIGDGCFGTFYYDTASTQNDDGGLFLKPNSVSSAAPGRWVRLYDFGEINVRWYGAIGDRTSNPLSDFFPSLAAAQVIYPFATALSNEIDWCAAQAAINYLKVAWPQSDFSGRNVVGGTVLFPRGIYMMDQPLDINSAPSRFSIKLQGIGTKGAPGSIFRGGAAWIFYTGAGDRFVDMRSSFACGLQDLTIWYNNAAFRGNLVDYSWGASENDAFAGFVDRCSFSGDPAVWPDVPDNSAQALINLWNAISCFITECTFGIAYSAIRLRTFEANHQPYSNAMVIRDCTFQYAKQHITNPGEMNTIDGCTFEGLGGFTEAAVGEVSQFTKITPERIFSWNTATKKVTCSSGSWIDDGFEIGMTPFCLNRTGATNEVNTGTYSAIVSASATELEFTDISITGIPGVTEWTNGVTSDHATLSDTGAFGQASEGVELVFAGSTITRNNGSWIDDNWQVGFEPQISGTVLNNGAKTAITNLTDTVMTCAGTTFVGETTSGPGLVYYSTGFGTFRFSNNWLGDQFLPGSIWLNFNNPAFGAKIDCNFFAGATRVAQFSTGGGSINFDTNHLVASLVPVYFDPLGLGWGSAVFEANQVTGPIWEGGIPASNVWMAGNSETGVDYIDMFPATFILRGAQLDMQRSGAFTEVGSYQSAALLLTQGGNSLGLGCSTLETVIQAYGARLRLNPYSSTPVSVGRDSSLVGVAKENTPTSCLDVGGAIATPYIRTIVNRTAQPEDSFILGNCTAGSITLTLPTAVGITGREYTLQREDASGNTIDVATTGGQTIGGGASPYALATAGSTVTVKSDGANWLIVSKIA